MGSKSETSSTRYGFRRLDCVRIRVGRAHTTAEVVGTVHRYPRIVSVPLSVAARLASRGVPVVVVRDHPKPTANPPATSAGKSE